MPRFINKNSKNDADEKQTVYDKCLLWFKNKIVFVAILLVILIYTGISELIKTTKENKENLFGKDGLLPHNKTVDSLHQSNRDTPSTPGNPKFQFMIGKSMVLKPKIKILDRIVRDTVFLSRVDTIYFDTSYKKAPPRNYSFHMDNLREGQTFIDPLTSSSVSIFNIQSGLTARAVLAYPNGFFEISSEKPPPIEVTPGQSWNDVHYKDKNFKLTILDINFAAKCFSIEIQEID